MSASLLDPRARQESAEVKLALGLFRLSQAIAAVQGGAAILLRISPLQLQILADLFHEPSGFSTVGRFAARYGISAPTVSVSVAALVRRGLLSRAVSPEDHRRVRLALTAMGRRVAGKALKRLQALVEMVSSLPAATSEACLDGVIRLIRAFVAAGWVRTDRICMTCRFFERTPGAKSPYYCRLVKSPLPSPGLRVDCPEHEVASAFAPRAVSSPVN